MGAATVRFARGVVPVHMNRHTIWTRYYGRANVIEPFAQNSRWKGIAGCACSRLRLISGGYVTDIRAGIGALAPGSAHRWLAAHARMGDHFLILMKRR